MNILYTVIHMYKDDQNSLFTCSKQRVYINYNTRTRNQLHVHILKHRLWNLVKTEC